MEENQRIEKASELNVSYDIEDFELEGLGFKPINAGLGFHGEREKVTTYKKEATKARVRPTKINTMAQGRLQHSPESMPLGSVTSGLEAFYAQKNDLTNTVKVEKVAKESVKLEDATLSSRLFSYLLDSTIILVTVFSMYFVFSLIAYGETSLSNYKTFVVVNSDFLLLLTFITYISYFTLLDGIGTIGKKLFGIKLESFDDNAQINMIQVFNRTVVCLLGTLAFFIPCIIDLHGKLSRTKVVNNNV